MKTIEDQLLSALQKFEANRKEPITFTQDDMRLNMALLLAQDVILREDGNKLEINLSSCGCDITLKNHEGKILSKCDGLNLYPLHNCLRAGIEEILMERFK